MRKALSPNRTNEAFHLRTLPGRARRCHDFVDSHIGDAFSEYAAIRSITIADQEPRSGIFRERLDDLLSSPLGRRMRCYVEVDDFPVVVMQQGKGEEYAECSGRNGEKVNCYDVSNVIVEEGAPSL